MPNTTYEIKRKLNTIGNILNSDINLDEYNITFSELITYRNELIFHLKYKSLNKNGGYYIWRTRKDGKVRKEHADNDGKLFSYDTKPPTGHPGEDYGCRCWA